MKIIHFPLCLFFIALFLNVYGQLSSHRFDNVLDSLKLLNSTFQDEATIKLTDSYLKGSEPLDAVQLALLRGYKGRALTFSGHAEEGLLYLKKALACSNLQQRYPDIFARFRQTLGRNYEKHGEYFKSHKILLQAREDWHLGGKDSLVLVSIEKSIGYVLTQLGKTQEAKQQLQKTIEVIQEYGLEKTITYCDALLQLARSYFQGGDYHTSLTILEKCQAIYFDNQLEDEEMLGLIYLYFGNANLYKGSFEEALSYFLEYKRYVIKTNHTDDIAGALFSIGLAYHYLRMPLKAEQNMLKASEACQQYLRENHPLNFTIYQTLGNILVEQKKYEKAVSYLEKSLQNMLSKKNQNKKTLAFAYNNLGLGYLAQEQTDKAILHFLKGEQLLLENDGEGSPLLVIPITHLSQAFQTKGDCATALSEAERTLRILNFSSETPLGNFPYPHYLLMALKAKADAHWCQFEQTKQLADLQTANQFFLKGIAVIDALRNGYQEQSQLTLLKSHYSIIEGAVKTHIELANYEPQIDHRLKAWQIAEQTKARLLYDEQQNRLAKFTANIPDTLLQKEKNLKNQIVQWQQTAFVLEKQGLEDSLKAVYNKLFILKQDLQKQEEEIRSSYPSYQKQIEQLQQTSALKKEEIQVEDLAVIEFFIHSDGLFIFVITQQQGIKTVELDKQNWQLLEQHLKDWQLHITNPKSPITELLENISSPLTSAILPKLPPKVNRLLIIPDGIIGLFPFEILEYDGKQLLENYTISYAYSWFLQKKGKAKTTDKRNILAAFAPTYKNDRVAKTDTLGSELLGLVVRSGDYELPGAQLEAREIAEILNGNFWIGEDATENHFKALAKDYQILHLAMHALTEPENAKFSRLLFSNITTDTIEDQSLTALELMNMQLNADLAVLSACNTGVGEIQHGEGILSLSRAFAYSGVPATVTSLWKVPDEQTREIMVAFYENLKAGQDKASALLEAKKDYLQQAGAEELKHPYFWAGFILTGNTSPISIPNSTINWTVLLIAFLLGVAAFFIIKIFFKKN